MEETTHDSSSSSRKSEEKCPPAGGIKMIIGGFKTCTSWLQVPHGY